MVDAVHQLGLVELAVLRVRPPVGVHLHHEDTEAVHIGLLAIALVVEHLNFVSECAQRVVASKSYRTFGCHVDWCSDGSHGASARLDG